MKMFIIRKRNSQECSDTQGLFMVLGKRFCQGAIQHEQFDFFLDVWKYHDSHMVLWFFGAYFY